jgi:hypothetical protein
MWGPEIWYDNKLSKKYLTFVEVIFLQNVKQQHGVCAKYTAFCLLAIINEPLELRMQYFV